MIEKIKFIPQDKLSETLNSSTVKLPSFDGTNFVKKCNTPNELFDFICKFDNVSLWEDYKIIKMIEYEDNIGEYYYEIGDDIFDVYLFNEYFPPEEQHQLYPRKVNTYSDKSFELSEQLQNSERYPLLVSYCCVKSFDRSGDIECCDIKIIPLSQLDNGIFIPTF